MLERKPGVLPIHSDSLLHSCVSPWSIGWDHIDFLVFNDEVVWGENVRHSGQQLGECFWCLKVVVVFMIALHEAPLIHSCQVATIWLYSFSNVEELLMRDIVVPFNIRVFLIIEVMHTENSVLLLWLRILATAKQLVTACGISGYASSKYLKICAMVNTLFNYWYPSLTS